MKVLITGCEGFVGTHLASFLNKHGDHTIGTYFNAPSTAEENVFMDITNYKNVFETISNKKPDCIVHLAGFSSVGASFSNPELCFTINVDGTRNLLQSIIENDLSPMILVIGSGEAYGINSIIPTDESCNLKPVSPYGESRVAQERLCHDFIEKYGMSIILTRSFNHSGPGQADTFVLSSFAKQIVNIELGHQEILKTGNLSIIRDFCDVRDVVDAYYKLLTRGNIGDAYNVCSNKGYSIEALLEIMKSLTTRSITVIQDKSITRPNDIPVLIGDNKKIRETTGWKPKIKIHESLRDLIQFWREKIPIGAVST